MKTGTVEGEADMETVSCAFSLLCLILGGVKWRMSSRVDVENERAEWMWRMSEQSGCGEYLMRIFICVWQKKILLCVFDIM